MVAITLRVMSGSTDDFRTWNPYPSSVRLAERDDDMGVFRQSLDSSGRAARANGVRSGAHRELRIDTWPIERARICDDGSSCTHRDLALHVPLANHTIFVIVIERIVMSRLILVVASGVRMMGIAMRVGMPNMVMRACVRRRRRVRVVMAVPRTPHRMQSTVSQKGTQGV